MSSLLRKCLVLPFVLTVSLPLSARPRPNKTAEPGVQINVCVYNLAELSPDTLDQAEREAGRIFQKQGLKWFGQIIRFPRLTWSVMPSAGPLSGQPTFVSGCSLPLDLKN
jgi:hypothetical protein